MHHHSSSNNFSFPPSHSSHISSTSQRWKTNFDKWNSLVPSEKIVRRIGSLRIHNRRGERRMPFNVLETLGDVKLVKKDGSTVETSVLEGKTVGFLFSAHWCPPCRKLTPAVKKFYETLGNGEFEVVFVSADRTEPDMMEYMELHGDWPAIPFGDPLIKSLSDRFRVMGLPCFAIINPNGIVAAKKQAKNDILEKKKSPRSMLHEWKKAKEDCKE